MNKLEIFVLKWTGTVITAMGFIGALVAIQIDEIRGFPHQIGWFQILGIMVFLVTMLFGVFVNKFLGQVREMINQYLND